MASPSPLPGILRLPRELRDEIYVYLIHARTEAPLYPSLPGKRLADDRISYEFSVPQCQHWRYSPLVWTNRQLRNEYFALISSLLASGHLLRAEVDIMVKGYLQWPTWTYLPPYLAPHIPFDLDVQLRVFSTEGFGSNDGWPRQPGTAFRDLTAMLNRFIHFGPYFFANKESSPGGLPKGWLASEWSHPEDQPRDFPMLTATYPGPNHSWVRGMRSKRLFKINTLSVHITYQDDYPPDTWPETTHTIFKGLKDLATVGVAHGVIKTVHAHATYLYKGKTKVFDAAWDVPEEPDFNRRKTWVETGFLGGGCHCLSDEYLPDLWCRDIL